MLAKNENLAEFDLSTFVFDIGKMLALLVVYDRNLYFGLGPVPKPKPKLADTFS